MLGFAPLCSLSLCSLPGAIVVPPIVLPPAALAEMYGGYIGSLKGKKKKKKELPPLEVMVEHLAAEPEGKIEVIKVLPKRVQQFFPDPGLALVSELVKKATGHKNAKIQLEAIRELLDRSIGKPLQGNVNMNADLLTTAETKDLLQNSFEVVNEDKQEAV